MKEHLRMALWGSAVVVGLFGLTAIGLFGKSVFAPWAEQIRYDTHKESQTYRDGMQRTLDGMIADYNRADAAGRIGIKEAIRHQFSQVDTSEFPAYQQDFLRNTIGIY